MNDLITVVRNNKGGGYKYMVSIPTRMTSEEYVSWYNVNHTLIHEAYKFLDANISETSVVVADLGERPIFQKRAMAAFPDNKMKLFQNRLNQAKLTKTIIHFREKDSAWDDGYVEYLIDRFEYECDDRFNLKVFITKPKHETKIKTQRAARRNKNDDDAKRNMQV